MMSGTRVAETFKNAVAAAAVALLAGCASMGTGPSATANLQPTRGNTATGTVTFSQQGGKVRVAANVSGLTPNQEHGFHAHEKGDCSSGDGMSAGGHFNPFNREHGHMAQGGRHAGDLPNLRADSYGNASLDTSLDIIAVADGQGSIVGKAVIVHVQPDDYKSQPVGNAGARMACGVVQRN